MSDSVYVEVMARLVLLEPDMTTEADVPLGGLPRDSARRRVLERYGVDAEQLVEFAEERGRTPVAMAEIWQRIQQLSDSLESDGWRPPGTGESAPPPDPDSTEAGAAS